jgi:hypothetical protein
MKRYSIIARSNRLLLVAFQASEFSLNGVRKFRGETAAQRRMVSEAPGLVMIIR